jgi:cytochrome c556
MKKILLSALGLAIFSGAFAANYTVYSKPGVKADQLGQVSDQNPQFQAIFAKDDWIEIVNTKNGQVGWVERKLSQQAPQDTHNDSVEQMMENFKNQQQKLDQHFNRMLANINQNVAQLQNQPDSTSENKSKVFKQFSSISISSDGKTAKIIKKTKDGNGNVKTIEKEIPADQIKNLEITS